MGYKLAIIAVTGLAISAVSLTAAAMVGGQELHDKGFDIFNWEDKPRCDFDTNAGTETRLIPWDGNDDVAIKIPAAVRYRAGSGDMVEIKGHPQSLTHIRIKDGDIEFDCNGGSRRNGEFTVTLPGRTFKQFSLQGEAQLLLENIDQQDLEITLGGENKVRASGRADSVKLTMAGESHASMGDLAVATIKITIMGHGEADIAPRDEAKITVMGEGTVRLMTEPKSLQTHIMGSGRVIHAAPVKPPI